MAVTTPILDLLLIDTHSAKSIGISDFSQYPTNYSIISPTLEITASGFSPVTIPFTVNSINIFTSLNLNITCGGQEIEDLPDGIYTIKYSIAPAYINNVTRSFIRIEKLQEKFDTAFMKLDILQCDGPLRAQKEEELNSIYYYIQEAVACANKNAPDLALKLYKKADKMLNYFIQHKCNCHG
ncbi:MAG: hypothetical protein WCP46_00635 [Alphaproteobacteria bacterium]